MAVNLEEDGFVSRRLSLLKDLRKKKEEEKRTRRKRRKRRQKRNWIEMRMIRLQILGTSNQLSSQMMRTVNPKKNHSQRRN
jgi:hypothetical protein